MDPISLCHRALAAPYPLHGGIKVKVHSHVLYKTELCVLVWNAVNAVPLEAGVEHRWNLESIGER